MAKKQEEQAFDYRKTTERLEEILARLQGEATDVDEALALYQEGMELVRQTEAYLQTAEHTITSLKAAE